MSNASLERILEDRFGEHFEVDPALRGLDVLTAMAARGSRRAFRNDPVDARLIDLLCAIAFSSPTKSDLQQRDIVLVRDPRVRRALTELLPGNKLVASAPELLFFCGNNRRQRQIHDWRGHPFPNDHLDAFFNAAVDAGIALSAFVIAAEAVGLGCCPISTIRDRADGVAKVLGLPRYVFPVAGMAVGWPKDDKIKVSMRLPTRTTLHVDRFDDSSVEEQVEQYDRRREAAQPYAEQRSPELYGTSANGYGWSEDKARQYSVSQRQDFGSFVRAQGFNLE
ncbi:MAG: hypothetical protein RLZ98_3169 [Pseudomonadota bacterium]|jgi:nitroreductase/FMN reductase [NAD(P)H]